MFGALYVCVFDCVSQHTSVCVFVPVLLPGSVLVAGCVTVRAGVTQHVFVGCGPVDWFGLVWG